MPAPRIPQRPAVGMVDDHAARSRGAPPFAPDCEPGWGGLSGVGRERSPRRILVDGRPGMDAPSAASSDGRLLNQRPRKETAAGPFGGGASLKRRHDEPET